MCNIKRKMRMNLIIFSPEEPFIQVWSHVGAIAVEVN